MQGNPCFLSYNRQGNAANLLVFIQGIDIRHATDVVDNSHETCLKIWGTDMVLAADTPDELSGVETLGMNGSLDELFHERLDNLITGELHVEHGFTAVDAFYRQQTALAVSLVRLGTDMVDEAAPERAREDLILMIDKHPHTLAFE